MNISPINYSINTNSKKPNMNINLICCEEQILFGLMRLNDLDYHIRDNNKRLIDFIYGRHVHERIKDFNAELISGKRSQARFDFEKNFKEHKEEICKFYNVANNLSDNQIKSTVLEKINLSFLR